MNNFKSTVKIQSDLLHEIRKFLLGMEFLEIKTPKLSFLPTDQDNHLFNVDYFGTQSYLVQTPQFYKQAYIINGINSIFEIGPVFRAEPRVTERHLTEFNSLDVESSNFIHLEDILRFEEKLLKEISKNLIREHSQVKPLESFEIVTYKEIKKALNLMDSEPIGNLHESEISNYFCKDGIFIINYPVGERVFYYEEKDGVSQSYDLIARGLEITSGGIRKISRNKIVECMKRERIDHTRYAPYLELFDDTTPVHGGFGLGIERLMSRLLLIDDVGEVLPYSKKPNNKTDELKWKP